MDLVFKPKSEESAADKETRSLFEFLKTYPQYIELSFAMLCRKCTGDENISASLGVSPEIDTVEEDDKLNTYYDAMSLFYDTNRAVLDIRRGKLLELLVSNIKPVNTNGDYNIILESLVEYKGRKISKKDIDVVFQYNDIELIECKSSLSSYLYPPDGMDQKKKDKMDFMEEVKDLAIQSSINCHLFFATYCQDKELCKDILVRNGYSSFGIINRERIIESLWC